MHPLASCRLAAGILLLSPLVAQAQFDELVSKIPPSANAIVAVDVKELHQTELAAKEGWTRRHEEAYVSRPVFLPPEADKLLLAADLNASGQFEPVWELGVMSLPEPLAMRSIARAEGGYLDTINGLEAAWVPSNAYFVAPSPNTVGVMYPADRQGMSRWADYARTNRQNRMSDYLQQAVLRANQAPQIVMAIDLKDVPRPHELRRKLQESSLVKELKLSVDGLTELIRTIQGVTLTITVDDKAQGNLRIGFGRPVDLSAAAAKQLVLHILAELGAELPGLEDWNYSVVSNSIQIDGEVGDSALRRLFTLVELPSSKFSSLADETVDPTAAPSQSETVEASQAYLKQITVMTDDLRDNKRDPRGGQDAVWMERYARKIDRMPILNVDEELLEYGTKLSETLRTMALSRRGAGLSAGARKSTVYGSYAYNYNNYGYYNRVKTEDIRNSIDRQEQNAATAVRSNGWKLIDDATADIRKRMTQKYQVEF